MPATLFTNVQIFDGSGAPLRPGEVRVEGRRIAAVDFGNGVRIARDGGLDVIDGQGSTLMPGLIEPHAHLTFTSAVDRIVKEWMPPVEDHTLYAAHNAKVLLDYGFTSAFSGGATRPRIEVKLRDEIAAGFLPGPRLRAASFERNVAGERTTYGQGVEEVKKFAREMIDLGVDTMKLVLSGRGSVVPKYFQELSYDEAELSAVSDMAREAGVHLAAHAYSAESVRLAVRFGFHAIYHCNFADEPTLDLMEDKKDQFFVAPAVGIIVAGLKNRDQIAASAPERAPEAMQGLQTIFDAQRSVIPKMRKRGIRVLPGGDYGFPHNPHGRNAWDAELFVTEFGYGPAEVLKAMTQYGGQMMGMPNELGLVKEGYLADLILVDGDPTRDIRLLQDRDHIKAIMQEGSFRKREARQPAYAERSA
jgi:imidazolonepropionase-like amidohydrolase